MTESSSCLKKQKKFQKLLKELKSATSVIVDYGQYVEEVTNMRVCVITACK